MFPLLWTAPILGGVIQSFIPEGSESAVVSSPFWFTVVFHKLLSVNVEEKVNIGDTNKIELTDLVTDDMCNEKGEQKSICVIKMLHDVMPFLFEFE